MEALLFVILVAAVTVVGVGFGLALAPRLTRWDDRRSRSEGNDPVVGRREDERD